MSHGAEAGFDTRSHATSKALVMAHKLESMPKPEVYESWREAGFNTPITRKSVNVGSSCGFLKAGSSCCFLTAK